MKPRILDLYCGAGGCARGYQRGGFHVIGVDLEPQPRYAGDEFVQADALEFAAGFDWSTVDAVHASPPCHDHSTVSGRNRKATGPKGTGWMLDATIDVLVRSGRPFVVENVGTADFPPNAHGLQRPRFRSLDSRQKGLASVVGVHGHLNYAGEFDLRCKAMGIDWMTNAELSQAIPPSYTTYVGEYLLAAIREEVPA